VGGYYWYPRPYYFYYYPDSEAVPSVPSYYGNAYYPVQPNAAPGVVATVAAARPPLPVFGLGVSGGGTRIDNGNTKTDASNLSALARLRLTDGLLIEGELGRTSFKDDSRVDRRIGGFLVWELGARNTLAPFLLAGGGVQQANVDGDFKTRQEFGEIGVGLRLALSRNLHLALDIRAGRAKTIDSNNDNNRGDIVPLVRVAAPTLSPPDTEDFTRGRLAAILYF
jgi:hypothetical protein